MKISFVYSTAIAPDITTNPAPLSLSLGTAVSLRCEASARPDPTYSWFRDGDELSVEDFGNSARTSRLDFNLTPDRRGGYYCVATNIAGTDQTSTAFVTITGTDHTHIITLFHD